MEKDNDKAAVKWARKHRKVNEPKKIQLVDLDFMKNCIPDIPGLDNNELTPVQKEALELYKNAPDLSGVRDSIKKLMGHIDENSD